MPKVLIVYHSRTGNTAQMARFVAEGARDAGADVEVKPVAQVSLDDLQSADAIVIGSPTYYGTMAAEVKELLDRSVEIHGRLDGKVGGAFASAGGVGGGQQTTIVDMLCCLLVHGMIVQGDPGGDHFGPVAVGSPDERAEAQCRRWGERLATLAQRLQL